MEYLDIDISKKINFHPNMLVDISVDGRIERGWIAKVLSSGNADAGIKVELTNGKVGRVYGVPKKNDLERKNLKYYNLLINNNEFLPVFIRNKINSFDDLKKFDYSWLSENIQAEIIYSDELTELKDKQKEF
jgi:uncharacterized protein YwbE